MMAMRALRPSMIEVEEIEVEESKRGLYGYVRRCFWRDVYLEGARCDAMYVSNQMRIPECYAS